MARSQSVVERSVRVLAGGEVALAMLGAVLFAVAAYLPWFVGISSAASSRPPLPFNSLAGMPVLPYGLLYGVGTRSQPLASALGILFQVPDYVWSGWTVVGILLVPTLWGASFARPYPVPRLFRVWVLGSAGVGAILAVSALVQAPWTRVAQYGLARVEVRGGLPLALLALMLTLPALHPAARSTHVRATRAANAPRGVAAMRSARRSWRVGAALLTLGALIWALGYFALPWVSSGCAAPTLSLTYHYGGTCQAMDAAEALTFAFDPTLFPYNAASIGTIYLAVYLLLAFGTGLAILAVWRPFRSRGTAQRTESWLWLWLALALGSTLLTALGAHIVTGIEPTRGGITSPHWRVDTGLPVAGVGLLLAALALLLLVWTTRPATQTTAPDEHHAANGVDSTYTPGGIIEETER